MDHDYWRDKFGKFNTELETDELEVKELFDNGYLSNDENDIEEEKRYHEPRTRQRRPFGPDYRYCVVIDNIPKVPEDKYPKVIAMLTKVFKGLNLGNFDAIQKDFPKSEDGSTLGFGFFELENLDLVRNFIAQLDNFKLDKKHTFRAMTLESLMELHDLTEEFTAPPKPSQIGTIEMREYLQDDVRRDQFVVRHNMETEIFWCEPDQKPTMVYGGEVQKQNGKRWCEGYVQWSPQGSYLATYHAKGIALWGGEGFSQISKFEHGRVQDCIFSKEEKYVVTVSETESKLDMVIWNAKQQKPLRALSSDKVEGEGLPILKWGYDDRYIAQIATRSAIYVYELPSMKLKDDRSFKAEGVREFFWSPTDNIIAYWVPESGNNPARVALIDVETRKDVRQKNLFHVSDIKIHWSPTGDYCAVKVTRHTKSKKTFTVNFEIFRVREEMVPVETLEMKEHEVAAFAWEPKGNRFALCHKLEKDARFCVSFYTMISTQKAEVKVLGKKKTVEKEVREITLMYTLKDKMCNHLYWNPNGQYIVLAGLQEMNGTLEFWDVNENFSMGEQEHFRCNSISWDPSGRYVAASTTQPIGESFFKYSLENGYSLWTFQGDLIFRQQKEACFQVLWRPRMRALLTLQEEKEIVKNLKKYEKKYADEDKKLQQAKQNEKMRVKRAKLDAFRDIMKGYRTLYAQQRAERIALRDGAESDNDDDYIIETEEVEEVVSSTEEVETY